MHRVDNATATPSGTPSTAIGISTQYSSTITGLNSVWLAANIKVGYWMSFDKGFTDISQPYEVIATTATTITITENALSDETDIVVTPFSNMYTDGDGGLYARTVINADEKNSIQEEIANTVEEAGLTLSDNDNMQLSKSVVFKTGDTMTGTLSIGQINEATPGNGVGIEDINIYNDTINDTGAALKVGANFFTVENYMIVQDNAIFDADVNVDDINERTASNGVNINDELHVDTITEKTSSNGVDIESVHIEDQIISNVTSFGCGTVNASGNVNAGAYLTAVNGVQTDVVFEKTPSNGVGIEDVNITDREIASVGDTRLYVNGIEVNDHASSQKYVSLPSSFELRTDEIKEYSTAAGVTIDSVLLKDGAVTTNEINDTGSGLSIDTANGLRIGTGASEPYFKVGLVTGTTHSSSGSTQNFTLPCNAEKVIMITINIQDSSSNWRPVVDTSSSSSLQMTMTDGTTTLGINTTIAGFLNRPVRIGFTYDPT